jgi:hypothetical protein
MIIIGKLGLGNKEHVGKYSFVNRTINTLNAELNPICHLLALLGAHPILYINRIRVKSWNQLYAGF